MRTDRPDQPPRPALQPKTGGCGKLHDVSLIEIGEFSAVRRRLGVARAALLTRAIAERVAALCPNGSVSIVGRHLVELDQWHDAGADSEAATAATEILLGDLSSEPFSVDGVLCSPRLLIGTAHATAADDDQVALIEQAEAALAIAREQDRRLHELSVESSDDQMLGRQLRLAIERDELFVQYQPKLHLREQRVNSLEALIRWHHPQRGLVMPGDFIAAAERTGDIAALTLWTLHQVIRDQRTLIRNGHDLPVFVNMAGVLLSDAAFIAQVIAVITAAGTRIGIEITETSVIGDPQVAIDHLRRLADIGVIITIDDYGAGLSSLAYLKQLPASELKIDKLFVTQLSSSHRDPLIVRSTIDLAHALDMQVVAEGVETPASLALLSVMGCDMAQGFLISRPLTIEALLPYLREDRHLAIAQAPRPGFGLSSAFRSQG